MVKRKVLTAVTEYSLNDQPSPGLETAENRALTPCPTAQIGSLKKTIAWYSKNSMVVQSIAWYSNVITA